jgi:hypothetical protein
MGKCKAPYGFVALSQQIRRKFSFRQFIWLSLPNLGRERIGADAALAGFDEKNGFDR